MIRGHATPEGTARYTKRYTDIACSPAGTTGLLASAAGFGCYRVAAGVGKHEAALAMALDSGINLIDTSTNYADGGSESMVGQVMERRIACGKIQRDEIIVVSKVGYLQGTNLALGRERAAAGNPFPDTVPYGKNIEHCIHPEFLDDQMNRSLERLGMETIDIYLLHNPEYYLDWAAQNDMPLNAARVEYYRRITLAFQFLEGACKDGRIRFYGISSNTFPAASSDPEFTSLAAVCRIAETTAENHHFRAIQLPFNLFETGAILENNQPDGKSILSLANQMKMVVLINRPLNAFTGKRLIRLAEVKASRRQDTNTIIRKIRDVGKSEAHFWRRILPELHLPPALAARIKEQLAIGDILKHHWKTFGSYEHWRQARAGMLLPRVQGVMMFLEQQPSPNDRLPTWMNSHQTVVETALDAVDSIYSEAEAKIIRQINFAVDKADEQWALAETLSQKSLRAVRSTSGVTAVLVGMRQKSYVADVLLELKRGVEPADRLDSWQGFADRSQKFLL